jgi:cyclopropane-fatty-acyl-phospholipid synthase
MFDKYCKDYIERLLLEAGVKINGDKPWDIIVHNEALYWRLLFGGSLALGESYMDKWWDAKSVDSFIEKIVRAGIENKVPHVLPYINEFLRKYLANYGSRQRAFEIGEKHYDLGNDLFGAMLDKNLVYSCAYWKNSRSLEEAQEAKHDLICRKLKLRGPELKDGAEILDIGCGWGSFIEYAVKNYKIKKAVGITVSIDQQKIAQERCKGFRNVEIRLQDYRDVKEKFDRIISVGMFEHVGRKGLNAYVEMVSNCLKSGGLFLLHTIATNKAGGFGDPWIDRYIFPGGELPSVGQLGKAIEKFFVPEDWHNFGFYYDPTLLAWFNNFEKAWPKLKEKYDERFYRMWKYYLLSCAAMFRARQLQVFQIVLSKRGIKGGYTSVR